VEKVLSRSCDHGNSAHLDLDGALDGLSLLLLARLGLDTHDTTTPVAAVLLVLAGVAVVDGRDKLAQLGFVFTLDFGDGQDGGGLLVHDGAETGLALDNGVRDTHLAAQGGEEDDEFDGVDVVGDQDESGFLGFNQADDVVETVLDGVGFLGRQSAFAPSLELMWGLHRVR
jgi:hypothetical protein